LHFNNSNTINNVGKKNISDIFLSGSFYNILFLVEAKKLILLTTLQCKEKSNIALKHLNAFCNSFNELFHISLKRAAFPAFLNMLSGQIQAACS